MIQFDEWGVPIKRQVEKQERSKTPIQVSNELHSLIKALSSTRRESLEQVVSSAIIACARPHLNSTDAMFQTRYFNLIKNAEREIKQRYGQTKSRRSQHMREINYKRRIKNQPFTVPRPNVY